MILTGDCRDVLPTLAAESVDACVTDPPYELGFMGKRWDATGVAFDVAAWAAVLRVLKPGAHLLAFGGTRTHHRMVCAIEDAGFEIRDEIQWLYGSGFPKSLDVSKAIDAAAGVERDVLGLKASNRPNTVGLNPGVSMGGGPRAAAVETAPATEASVTWNGWGTALKPACEPICVARKPLVGTVAANVLEHGTGALNIDAARIGTEPGANLAGGRISSRSDGWDRPWKSDPEAIAAAQARGAEAVARAESLGRWPANVILDEEAAALLDAQSGELVSGTGAIKRATAAGFRGNALGAESRAAGTPMVEYGDSGGASRFYYVAKPSKAERGHGNTHPTVKPVDLLTYLVRLVTPPGGIVLDPFAGSGTTLLAAQEAGFKPIGIEMNPDYVAISERRLAQNVLDLGAA